MGISRFNMAMKLVDLERYSMFPINDYMAFFRVLKKYEMQCSFLTRDCNYQFGTLLKDLIEYKVISLVDSSSNESIEHMIQNREIMFTIHFENQTKDRFQLMYSNGGVGVTSTFKYVNS